MISLRSILQCSYSYQRKTYEVNLKKTFNREDALYLACNNENSFLFLNNLNDLSYSHVRKCVMLSIIPLSFGQFIYRILAQNYIYKL